MCTGIIHGENRMSKYGCFVWKKYCKCDSIKISLRLNSRKVMSFMAVEMRIENV